MPSPVVLALGLAGTIAVIVFVTRRRRLSTWLLVGAVCTIAIGGVVWSHEDAPTAVFTDRYAVPNGPSVRAIGAPAREPMDSGLVECGQDCRGTQGVVIFTSGPGRVEAVSGPNRAPAIGLFTAAGAMGLAAFVMIRRRRGPAGLDARGA
jgi:hypothetical protein